MCDCMNMNRHNDLADVFFEVKPALVRGNDACCVLAAMLEHGQGIDEGLYNKLVLVCEENPEKCK